MQGARCMWDDVRRQTCCLTGNRTIRPDLRGSVFGGTEIKLRELITRQGIRFFGVGGAIGYDTIAAEILFRLKETSYPHIRIILVYPFEGFDSLWTDEQRQTYAKLYHQYDKRVCISPSPSREAYLTRDRHLVDCSSVCVAHCTNNTGDAAYTLQYAQAQGLTIYRV